MAIDPTARVADGARIGDGVEIGPYCVIGPYVELSSGVRLISHVNVDGVTSVGEGTVVYPFARHSAATLRLAPILFWAGWPRSTSTAASAKAR
jgi:acyl-[acyl carrier protein]--UDP-N-acetylglucosamine O-acyltransferase